MDPAPYDSESARWLEDLRARGAARNQAHGRLHAMLLRVARAEANRRRGALPADLAGDLDDLCTQAANDALTAILAKLDAFRGASRFTTWAYKFAVLEISVRLRRRAWRSRRVVLDEDEWGRLADPTPSFPNSLEDRETLATVRRAIEETLTDHQRRVFLAVVGEDVPIDVVAERLGCSRGAVYKVVHDARRKLRAALASTGHLEER